MFKNLNYKKITKFIKQASVFLIVAFVIFVPIITSAGQPNNTNSNVDTIAKPDLDSGMMSLLGVNKILSFIAQTALWLSSLLLTLSGILFEQSIKYGIQGFAALADGTSMVTTGWVIARDLSNIMFIFLVLWVGISTILGLNHGSTMGSIMKIAIAAILINFSLFLAKAVIDVANVIALHFYDLLVGGTDSGGTLVGVFMKGLQMQGIYDPSAFKILDTSKIIMIGLFGSIMIIVASWIFISGAVLMLYRTISLIILMIMSPFAFISWVVPEMHDRTHDWWHKLFHQAFFAPIFMAMAYIVGKIIQTPGSLIGQSTQTISKSLEILSGGAGTTTTAMLLSAVGVFFNFLIVIGLLIACLHVAEHSGAKGAETMMHWGGHLGGMGQSFVMGNLIGKPARALDERLEKSYFGNTALGKNIRELTTSKLKDAKWGGELSGEERYEEGRERKAHLTEIAEVKGRPALFGVVGSSGNHNAVYFANQIDSEETKFKSAINSQEEIVKNDTVKLEEAKKRGIAVEIKAMEDNLSASKERLQNLKQEKKNTINDLTEKLQKILVRLTPHAFTEILPEEMFYNSTIMTNATTAQYKAVLESDHLPENKKDEVRKAASKWYSEATKEARKKMPEYIEETKKYVEELSLFNIGLQALVSGDVAGTLTKAGITDPAEIKRFVDKFTDIQSNVGTKISSPENTALIAQFKAAKNEEEREQAMRLFEQENQKELTGVTPKAPTKPSIAMVNGEARKYIRASDDYRLEQFYKLDPDLALDPIFMSTAKSSFTRYMRNSSTATMGDRDKVRDAKFFDTIDASDLLNGLGEVAPTFETFQHTIEQLVKAGAKNVEDLKGISKNDFEKFHDGQNGQDAWDLLKDTRLRPAIKNIADNYTEKYQDYLDNFNAEQKAMYSWGSRKMTDAIGGKSQDEYTLLRGARWMNPAFVGVMDRRVAQNFADKDTSDTTAVMNQVLTSFKKWIDDDRKMTSHNIDLLSWVTNDSRVGKRFRNRGTLKPELQPVFDQMLKVFEGKTNITTQTLDEITKEVNKLGGRP